MVTAFVLPPAMATEADSAKLNASAAVSSASAGLVSTFEACLYYAANRSAGRARCVDPVDFRRAASPAGVGVSLLA